MKLRSLLTNTSLFVITSLILMVISIFLDVCLVNTNFFQRAGSLVAGFGAIVLVRKQISMTYEEAVESENSFDGGTFGTDFDPIKTEARKNVNAVIIGTIQIFIGSFISSYGDFLIRLVK